MKKGFTLLEILVVVAIIGILAAVVLASLQSARSKGTDAATKEDLRSLANQLEIYYHTNTAFPYSYSGSCQDSTLAPIASAIVKNSGAVNYTVLGSSCTTDVVACNSNGNAWAISAPLKSGGLWCIDSTGQSINRATPLKAVTNCSVPPNGCVSLP